MPKTVFHTEPGSHRITMEREFDAPMDRVFRAMTDPGLIPRWWGPRRMTTVVERMDPRHGGLWRFINRDQDGNEYRFRGVHHEVAAPERIVRTFEYEGAPGHISLETVTLSEVGGKTLVRTASVYQSVEDKEAILASGMESGATETHDRLAEVVAEL